MIKKNNNKKSKFCSNCVHGKLGFSFFNCEKTGQKKTALDTCEMWSESFSSDSRAVKNGNDYTKVEEEICLICFSPVNRCIC